MTSETLVLITGAVVSLIFSYVPNLNVKFASLSTQAQKLIMLISLAVVTASIFGLACAGLLQDLFGLAIACEKASAIQLVKLLIFAIVSNQSIYKLTPQTQAVKDAGVQKPELTDVSLG